MVKSAICTPKIASNSTPVFAIDFTVTVDLTDDSSSFISKSTLILEIGIGWAKKIKSGIAEGITEEGYDKKHPELKYYALVKRI